MNPTGGNLIVNHLLKLGRQVTVESYLDFAYPDGVPSPLTAELKMEAELAVQQAKSSSNPSLQKTSAATSSSEPIARSA